MSHTPDNFHVEDAFVVGEDGWVTLPGTQGKISPDGMVYDSDGEPLYMLYEDSESPLNIYAEDEEDYEWI